MTTLYTKQSDKLRTWCCYADGDEVVVEHGQLGGKLTQKRYKAEPKNQGRANATTAEDQAILEVESKITIQKKRGYYLTQEEARNHVDFTPMKCLDYKDQAKKVKYPCYISAKLDGFRMMVDSNGQAWSKQGEPLDFPEHWKGLKEALAGFGADGEVFCEEMSLQSIRSAYLTPKEDTLHLEYWIYDVPVAGVPFVERRKLLDKLNTLVFEKGLSFVKVVPGVLVESEEWGDIFYNNHLQKGYEGSVYRNADGLYDFGKRSSNMIKRKPRPTNEALVLSYTLDKNDEPVYTVRAVNGEQTGAEFKLKMKTPDGVVIEGRNYRDKANADSLVGQHIEYAWENLSDSKVPCKPSGLFIRDMIGSESKF